MKELGKKSLVVLAAVWALVACEGGTKGVVLNVYGPEVTKATAQCVLKESWSLSIDTNGTPEGIKKVCVSEATAKKYKPGDTYP